MLEISEDDKQKIRENVLVCLDVSYQTEILPEDLTRLILVDLAKNTSVTRLVFWKCNLDDACVHALASSLQTNGRAIDYIDLNSNQITDDGLMPLLSLNNIKRIDCGYNAITDRAVPAILVRDKDRRVNLLGNISLSKTNRDALCLHFKYVKNDRNSENNSGLETVNAEVPMEPSNKLK